MGNLRNYRRLETRRNVLKEVWTCRAMLVSIHIQAVFLIHPKFDP